MLVGSINNKKFYKKFKILQSLNHMTSKETIK